MCAATSAHVHIGCCHISATSACASPACCCQASSLWHHITLTTAVWPCQERHMPCHAHQEGSGSPQHHVLLLLLYTSGDECMHIVIRAKAFPAGRALSVPRRHSAFNALCTKHVMAGKQYRVLLTIDAHAALDLSFRCSELSLQLCDCGVIAASGAHALDTLVQQLRCSTIHGEDTNQGGGGREGSEVVKTAQRDWSIGRDAAAAAGALSLRAGRVSSIKHSYCMLLCVIVCYFLISVQFTHSTQPRQCAALQRDTPCSRPAGASACSAPAAAQWRLSQQPVIVLPPLPAHSPG